MLDGIQAEMSASGIDVGAMAEIDADEIEPLTEVADVPPGGGRAARGGGPAAEAAAGAEAGAAPV